MTIHYDYDYYPDWLIDGNINKFFAYKYLRGLQKWLKELSGHRASAAGAPAPEGVLSMTQFMKRFARDEEGASLVEYTVLIALVTVGVIALIGDVGDLVVAKWEALKEALQPPPAG